MSTLPRYTRLRPMSEKTRKKLPARRACVATTLKRAGYKCEIQSPDCTKDAVTAHEILPRAQGGDPTDPSHTLATCIACNRYVHSHPNYANERGFIYSRKWEAANGRPQQSHVDRETFARSSTPIPPESVGGV